MASLNKVFLIGNLTRDPERRTLPSGMAVTEIGLAVNRRFRTQSGEDRDETTYVNISLFGKQAETAVRYLRKGRQVFIEGRLKFDSWEGKDGQKRSRLTVIGERFQFIGGERSDSPSSVELGDTPDRLDTPPVTDSASESGMDIDPGEMEAKNSDNLPF